MLSQREEAERKRLLFQCECDPTAIHGLPQLRRALQEHRSQCLRDSGMTFSHSCITVEPAVGLCAFLSVVPRVTRAVSPIQPISTTMLVFYILICSFHFADLRTLHGIWISQISTLKYCPFILPSSSRECFSRSQSRIGFHHQSALFSYEETRKQLLSALLRKRQRRNR